MIIEPSFGGKIGRTYQESTPHWPAPPSAIGKPNVVTIILDDTGFSHLGCYGSTLSTPNIDALAAGGLLYTNFHTTGLCSPSRAAVITGRNHHSVGMRGISNWNTGFPNMRGGISKNAATTPELLRSAGYATFAVGKWHLAPMIETSAAGPYTNWPLQRGFDRYYGFLQGEADQFYPELTYDNHHVDPPKTPEQGYHVSEDIIDHSILWLRDLLSIRPDRPFYLYVAFGATHAPHQSPLQYRQKWRGAFDSGYDVIRQQWYERQLERGIIPPNTTLAPRNPGVPPWDELTENQKKFSARLQEAFAAILEHTDDQIGRLVSFLSEQGQLDNTLILLLSDNGASREGGPYGVKDEFSFFNGKFEDIDYIVENSLDEIGGPYSHSNYPWGWAQAGNTPLRWYKQNTYGGGVRDPLIVHWPAGIKSPGEIRRQFCHAIDLAATVLDVTGTPLDQYHGGQEQIPLHGQSITPTFNDPLAPPIRSSQYFEQMGHRGIYLDGWKATTYHEKGTPYEDDEWELFDLSQDFSECHNLAEKYPDRLGEMIDAWWSIAQEMGVLPLDDRNIELFGVENIPASPHSGNNYRYLPPISHIPSDACPVLGGRPWTLKATIEASRRDPSGVIYARGSHNVGHSFFIMNQELVFDYNALGEHYQARAAIALELGTNTLFAKFDREGQGGILSIGVGNDTLATVPIPNIVRMLGSTGMDLGRDGLSNVALDYEGDFPFTEKIKEVTFEIRSRRSQKDLETIATVEMSRE